MATKPTVPNPMDRDAIDAYVSDHPDTLPPINHIENPHHPGFGPQGVNLRPGDVLANKRWVKVILDFDHDEAICYYLGDGSYMSYPTEFIAEDLKEDLYLHGGLITPSDDE